MRFTQSWLAVSAVVMSMAAPSVSWAKSALDLRIERLENIIDNQVNSNLLTQVDALQQELQELRGKLEVQQNELQALNQKQEKLYLNLDSRLSGLNKTDTPKPAATIEPVVPAVKAVVPVAVPIVAPAAQPADPIDQATQQSESTEKTSYDAAYHMMNSKQYAAAEIAFKNLLSAYPDGTYAANAYYWLGELYLLQWQQNKAEKNALVQAKDSFAVVLDKFKGHQKAVDALLKLGMVEIEQEHWLAARDLLNEVIDKDPNSSRARIAETKIKGMQQEGRI
jgi:tol-pal system protein YbgF